MTLKSNNAGAPRDLARRARTTLGERVSADCVSWKQATGEGQQATVRQGRLPDSQCVSVFCARRVEEDQHEPGCFKAQKNGREKKGPGWFF